jgi:hypothetical protein
MPTSLVAAPTAKLHQPNGSQLAFHRVDLDVSLDQAYSNPFDPDEVSVDASITSPDGKTMVQPGFWGSLDDREPAFHIRFCPTTAGRWTIEVRAKDREGRSAASPVTIDVQPSDERGFVRRSSSNSRYLQFDNGASYFPVGLNLAWSHGEAEPDNYKPWFEALSKNSGNFARLWMCHGPVSLENPKTGLNRYDLRAARYWDELLELAEKHGIYVMLTFMNHRELLDKDMWGPAGWPTTPYNAANAGPATRPVNFFTDPVARKMFKNRLRYIVARYSAFTNVMCWELFNEQELTRIPVTVEWNAEMAHYLRYLDPYGHLISSSAGLPDDVWKLDDMSITQMHLYGTGDVVDLTAPIVSSVKHHERFNKPHLIAEFGISYKGPDTEFDPHNTATTLHNSLWAAAMSGAAGTAMNWWWDNYIAPRDLWHEYRGIGKFAASVDWAKRNFHRIQLPPASWPDDKPETFSDLTLNAGFGWVKADPDPILVFPNGQSSGALPHFLFGPDKKDMRTKTTLLVETKQAGDMVVHINKVSDHACLRVWIDDQPTADFQFSALPSAPDHEGEPKQVPDDPKIWQADINKDRTIALAAGKHKIELDNIAGDWISVDRITIPGAKSSRHADLNTIALQDDKTGETLVWLCDAMSNWLNDHDGKLPREIENIAMSIPLPVGGSYQAVWWDTRSGEILRQEEVSSNDGNLTLKTPKFLRDIAVRVTPRKS